MKIILRGAFMDFGIIKAHFFNKKQQKEEQKWFQIEFKNDRTIHIVEQKIVEIILVDEKNSLDELKSCGWTKNLGWHEGSDGKIYERHALSDAGLNYYDRLNMRYDIVEVGPQYIKLLNEINVCRFSEQNDATKSYMYWRICNNFKENNIKSITKYKAKEVNKKEEKVSTLH